MHDTAGERTLFARMLPSFIGAIGAKDRGMGGKGYARHDRRQGQLFRVLF